MKLNGVTLSTPHVTTYGYDAVGNKISEVLPNGITTTYTYDDLNRLTDMAETRGGNTLFSEHYTLNDNGSRASSMETQVQADGSVQTITTGWTYDALNRLTGESVVYSSQVSAPPAGMARSFVLPAADAYIGEANPGTADLTLFWNGWEYVTSGGEYAAHAGAQLAPTQDPSVWQLTLSDGGDGVNSWSFTMSAGVLSNDTDPNNTWVPFSIGTASGSPNYSDSFSYDLASNRISKTHTGPGGGPDETLIYTYNSNDQLTHQVPTRGGATDFTYDPNGSMIQQVSHAPTYSIHLDPTFGGNGMATPYIGAGARITAQTILANGNILAVAEVNGSYVSLLEFNPDGSLDLAFGSGGVVTTAISGTADTISVLGNGDILLACNYSTMLAEFHADGSVNTSFGTAGTGIVLTSLSAGGSTMRVLSNGNIAVAGIAYSFDAGMNYTGHAVILEYNANGTLNSNFTSDVVPSLAGVQWNLRTVLANGNLLVASTSDLAEFDSNGHIVNSFGTNGIASLGDLAASAMVVLSNGQIVVAGTSPSYELEIEKFSVSGTLVHSFGSNGVVLMGGYWWSPSIGLNVLADGGILIREDMGGATNAYLKLGKINAENGSLDTTFGSGGFMYAALHGNAWVYAMTILPDGSILAGGGIATMTSDGWNEGPLVLAKFEVSGLPEGYSAATRTTDYTYDVRGKLVAVANDGAIAATYTYDDAGNRVSETVGGVTTLYLIDKNNTTGYAQPIEAKNSATGKPITTWIVGDRVFGQADANGTMTYLLTDGHGSTRLLTNANGTVTAAFNYDAFGTALNFNAGMAATPFLFGGDSFYDAPSGLNFHGDGTRTRSGFIFMQSDFGGMGQGNKNDPLSLHKYLYVWGNPVNGHDPSGHNLIDGLTQAGSVIAGTIGDAVGFGGYDVAMAFWGRAWEGTQAGAMAFADNFTFHQVGWLHDGRTAYWQQEGLAGTGIDRATNAAAWAATGAIDAAIVLGAWSVLGGILESEGAAGPNPQIIRTIKALADDAQLTSEQIAELGKNVDVILEKSLPVKADAGAIQDIVDLFQEDARFRFLDQVPGAWDSILQALDEYGYFN